MVKQIDSWSAIENDKHDPTLVLAFSLAKELKTTVNKQFEHLGKPPSPIPILGA